MSSLPYADRERRWLGDSDRPELGASAYRPSADSSSVLKLWLLQQFHEGAITAGEAASLTAILDAGFHQSVSQRPSMHADKALVTHRADQPALSVVIPIYNEEDSVAELYAQLTPALRSLGPYEIIFVDDGSTDGTHEALQQIAELDKRVKVIQFRRNFGQTAAMAAGFEHARGRVIIPMDADLQNDPADIPLLLEEIDAGYDVVSGWRKNRQDKVLLRKLPSRAANWLIGKVTGVRLHDYGCSLKAYRAEVVKGVRLYGEMHRFIPALANLGGARICEVPINHHARRFGKSKYGLRRTFKVLLDLVTVKFLTDYSTKPLYFFGGIGLALSVGGIFAALVTLWEKYALHTWVHRNPLMLVAIFLFSLGTNLILMGLLAEMILRTYHESQGKPIYLIRSVHNFDTDA